MSKSTSDSVLTFFLTSSLVHSLSVRTQSIDQTNYNWVCDGVDPSEDVPVVVAVRVTLKELVVIVVGAAVVEGTNASLSQ